MPRPQYPKGDAGCIQIHENQIEVSVGLEFPSGALQAREFKDVISRKD